MGSAMVNALIAAGVVSAIHYDVGERVAEGADLVDVDVEVDVDGVVDGGAKPGG